MNRRALAAALAGLVLLPTAPLPAAPEPERLVGFSAAGSAAQRALETRFDELLSAENLRDEMEHLAKHPHPVGSPWSRANAEHMAARFRSWGFDAAVEEFQVLFPTPKVRLLELTAPTRFTAQLREPPVPGDESSKEQNLQLPTYNAFSIDGDVTGELVYVNYGVPADYDELARRGIDVRGKIVIARYGGSWRGIKPKVAAEKGAIGCIIYSDPSGDGYAAGDVYPKGGFRNEHSVQRGSVADMPVFPGDPLTPGVGATPGAKRLARAEAPTLTKIPVLPISYGDAQPFLAALSGPMAPPAWRGGLPIPYHLGPGPATVRLKLEFDWRQTSAYDVIAKLRGAELPDQWVLRGNHHDGWVNGATDPVSGMVAVLEEARALGELAKAGFRPRRTVVYAGWDAEEPGLLGSTEWVETHADELRAKAVAYINSDSNSRGFLSMGGSHTLERLMNQVAADVQDPLKGISVLERLRAAQVITGSPAERKEARSRRDLRLDPLGSGSDYTPFLQHLGIATLDLGFGGEGDYGQYHSIYDTVEHFQRFMDPGNIYGVALAKVAGRATLRLANAETLPFDVRPLVETAGRYVDEVRELADTVRGDIEERNRRLADKTYEAFDDPRETWAAPPRQEPAPFLSFAPLQNAHAKLAASAEAFHAALAAANDLPAAQRAALDRHLLAFERQFTRNEGLPGRPWFRHHLYAPGLYTGYGVKTLPAVREAIEQRDWPAAERGIATTAAALEAAAKALDAARGAITEVRSGS